MRHTASSASTLRLLIPVSRRRRIICATTYAEKLRRGDLTVEVCLLHVLEPVGSWQALLHPAAAQMAIQRQRAEAILSLAAKPLQAAGISYAAYLRSGSVVSSLLDAAEELGCQEIVVPQKHRTFFSHNVVPTLLSRRRAVPVVVIDATGNPINEGGTPDLLGEELGWPG
jgi:nucleotide-binding universal stress UspA family protein